MFLLIPFAFQGYSSNKFRNLRRQSTASDLSHRCGSLLCSKTHAWYYRVCVILVHIIATTYIMFEAILAIKDLIAWSVMKWIWTNKEISNERLINSWSYQQLSTPLLRKKRKLNYLWLLSRKTWGRLVSK